MRARGAILALSVLSALGPTATGAAAPKTTIITVELQIDHHDVEDLKGIDLTLNYPKEHVSLPGVGTTEAIRQRVVLLADDPEKDDLFLPKVADATGTIRLVYARQPTGTAPSIGRGPIARITFDGAANPAEFSCEITGTSDTNGQKYEGVGCTVSSSAK